MKKLFFYAMLILTVVLTGCGKSEEQKIHSMYLNNSTKVAEMETEQAQAMLENRNIDKQKMLKQIKSLIEGRLQVQVEQNLSSNYISGIHLIKKSVEQFIRSVVA